MSDVDDNESIYGDDISIAESIGSGFEEEKEKTTKKQPDEDTETQQKEKEELKKMTDKIAQKKLHELYKNCIFQDISNDKLFVLQFLKSNAPKNELP